MKKEKQQQQRQEQEKFNTLPEKERFHDLPPSPLFHRALQNSTQRKFPTTQNDVLYIFLYDHYGCRQSFRADIFPQATLPSRIFFWHKRKYEKKPKDMQEEK